jgi:hypothetical protein
MATMTDELYDIPDIDTDAADQAAIQAGRLEREAHLVLAELNAPFETSDGSDDPVRASACGAFGAWLSQRDAEREPEREAMRRAYAEGRGVSPAELVQATEERLSDG